MQFMAKGKYRYGSWQPIADVLKRDRCGWWGDHIFTTGRPDLILQADLPSENWHQHHQQHEILCPIIYTEDGT